MAQKYLDLNLPLGSTPPPEIINQTGDWSFRNGGYYSATNTSSTFELDSYARNNDVTFNLFHSDNTTTGKYFAYEFRRVDAANYIRVIWDVIAGRYRVQQNVNGSTNELYDGAVTPRTNVTLRVNDRGSEIDFYDGETLLYTETNALNPNESGMLIKCSAGFYAVKNISYQDQTTSTNTKPVASLGADQNITTGQLFTADATGSSDGDNDTLTYLTTLQVPNGSSATIQDEATTTPSFTPDVDGEYVLTLIVNDGTEDSDPTTQTLTSVTATGATANAGNDSVQYTGSPFSLDGSASTGGSSYSWSLLQAPAGSSASVNNPSLQVASFTPDVTGLYQFQLDVDGSLDTVFVRARNQIPNRTPIAEIKFDGEFALGKKITLIAEGKYNA